MGVKRSPLEGFSHHFGRRLARSHGERGNGSVDDICTCFCCLKVGHGSDTARAVRMELNGYADGLLQR